MKRFSTAGILAAALFGAAVFWSDRVCAGEAGLRFETATAGFNLDRTDSVYEQGMKALDERNWDRAIELFSEVVRLNGNRSDGALYWKAYAQNKQGKPSEAVATLGTLTRTFPKSQWTNEARALEIEVSQAAGQPVRPESEADEELKLIAINALMQSNADQAIPMLQKVLEGNQSPKLKERALFVLAQNGSPKAREIITQIARGKANPNLQSKALNYLGLFGGKESRQVLADIYTSSSEVQVKRAILHSFMLAGDRERLLALVKSEPASELRGEAVRQLGVLGARTELWQLYQAESSPDIKESILNALFISGSTERLAEVAQNEKDSKLRAKAIQWLGASGSGKTGEILLSIYETDKDPSIRRTVLQGLFVQGNARALIDLARKETDISMKKEIVGKLSLMRSKEATEYMMEILNK